MEVFTRWFKLDEYLCVDEAVIGSWLQVRVIVIITIMVMQCCIYYSNCLANGEQIQQF